MMIKSIFLISDFIVPYSVIMFKFQVLKNVMK